MTGAAAATSAAYLRYLTFYLQRGGGVYKNDGKTVKATVRHE